MVDYASLATTADRLINKNGQLVTLQVKSRVDADVNMPWRKSTDAVIDQQAKAILINYTEQDIDGDLVRRGDQKAYVSDIGAGVILAKDIDVLIDQAAKIWKVQSAKSLEPGGIRLLLELQLRV